MYKIETYKYKRKIFFWSTGRKEIIIYNKSLKNTTDVNNS